MNISRSPERNTFQAESYKKTLAEDPTDEGALAMVKMYEDWSDDTKEKEQDPAWQKDNMEYDLRTTDWILQKVRADEIYAQHLYAAMCNRSFQRLDTWPILTNKKWGCSWRYAGGIVADMRQEGDYIDWYCSGITNHVTDEEIAAMDDEQLLNYKKYQACVGEGRVTDEIRNDLTKLGWAVLDEDDE